eukprot:gene3961-4511_t
MKDYEDFQTIGNYTWECPICNTQKECKSYLEILPFYGCELLSDTYDQNFVEELQGDDEPDLDSRNGTSTFENLTERRTKDKREILICHLNVNSLQNKIEELTMLNSSLKAQVMILTETKIDGTYSNTQFAWDSYNIHREDRKKGGGGILMYVVKDLCSKKVKPPKKYITIEVLAVQTKIEGENVLIVGMYRPPKISGSNYYEQLENELNELLTWASMQCSNIIIGGDLNLDKSKPGSREGKLLVDLEEVHDICCLIKQPTRITSTSQTLIDVFLTNKPEYHKLSGLFDPGISDHCMIFSLMTKKTQTHKKKIITFRSKKNLNIEELLQDLDQAPWHVGEIFESIDDQYFYWQNLLNRIIDDHMPWKRMRVRERDVPSMTTEWKKAIRKKRKYAREFSKNRSDENLALKRKWRNEATRQRRKAIKEYWDKKALDLKSNPGAFFKVFKPFLSAKNVQGGSDVISLETDGKLEENPQIVADTFVNYFNTMWDNGKEYEVEGVEEANVTKVAEQELDSNSSVINIEKNVNETRQVDYRPLIEKEVEEAMKDINPRKSAGWDKMAPGILKVGAKALAPSITRLYNECIRQMAWPSDWKKGQWTPAFKKDNRHIDKNYRPKQHCQ